MSSQTNNYTTNTFYSIDTIIDSVKREDDNNIESRERVNFENSIDSEQENISKKDEINELPNIIYRFKFTQEFMEELYKFSKIHQYDERKDFKEAWKVWSEDNNDLIDEEKTRLINLGYSEEGNILDKMFKSARYYFRKKSTEKKQPKQRRQYISVPRELLDSMDQHIEENIYNDDYQPKTGFISFCKSNETVLKSAIAKIYEQGISDSLLIEDKMKKTYKNRYFILTNKK
jgi:hypothetical protein